MASSLLETHVRPDGLRGGLQEVLAAYRSRATRGGKAAVPPLTRIPSLVHGAVTGEYAPALPLCGMALLAYLGIGLLDHLMDGDRNNFWQGASPAETVLVATTLGSALPISVLARLDADPVAVVQIEQLYGNALLRMSAGQREDILSVRNYTLDPGAVERSVAGKSGAFTGMLAEIAAVLAGAPPDAVEAYGDWGRGYGTADQLRSDLGDLFVDSAGSDLRSGSVTYPLACLMEATPEADRPATVERIATAHRDPEALKALREELHSGGSINSTAMTIRWHIEAARAALARVESNQQFRDSLTTMVTRLLPG